MGRNISDVNVVIAVIGLGYVGLPLAVEFGKSYSVIGYDKNSDRINALQKGSDVTLEVSTDELGYANGLKFTSDVSDLSQANVYLVTVPTPIDNAKRPDFGPLLDATNKIGAALKKGDVVVYESTVYPGVTEDICAPLLENVSGLKFNKDFYCGYSPERINPGDKDRGLTSIIKVTSGSTPEIASFIDDLYSSVITAGTHKAATIRVAEASKVIENVQRDLNIALMNELSIIFSRAGIETKSVLDASRTKWNFLDFNPGLVGGHCIGVDPYYLTHMAETLGYNPEVILAGRRINDNMASHVVDKLIRTMIKNEIKIKGSKLLVLGLTFKENCPDIRNSKVSDIVNALLGYGVEVDVYDPLANAEDAYSAYGIQLCECPKSGFYDAIILAVPHAYFIESGIQELKIFGKSDVIFFDVKAAFDIEESDLRL